MSTQFNCQKHFYFKLFKQLYITIQFSVSTVSMSKIVRFKIIQFSKSTQFISKYSLIVKKHLYFELFSLVKQFYFSLVKVQILFTHSYMSEQFYVKQFSFVSYPGHSLGESYPSAEVQSVYSTAAADWAISFGIQ